MREIPSKPPVRLDNLTTSELLDYFSNAWNLYEMLFGAVADDDTLRSKPDPLRHALIFYLGHTAVFYVNKLRLAGALERGIDARCERLFAVGVDPEHAADLPPIDWPPAAEVRDYRRRVHDRIAELIDDLEIALPVRSDQRALWALLMAIEHDRIHLETSSVLLRQLPTDRLRRPAGWEYANPTGGGRERRDPIRVPPGRVVLGKPRRFPTFGWDNEYGARTLEVGAFVACPDLVTNGEYLEFVADGGYARRQWWSERGWRWRESDGAEHPRFWVAREDGFGYRAMFDEMELPSSWPVEVNAHEARAYCRWRGSQWRLPTEGEFRRIADGCPLDGDDSIFTEGYNLGLACGSPTPVGQFAATESPLGFRDCYGNVWQWLADDFNPLEGFEPDPLYPDFSAPYFDDRHAMMLGGAWASTGTSGSRFYRLWFRRQFYQHAGFRIVRSC